MIVKVRTCIVERLTRTGKGPCGAPLFGHEQSRGICRRCWEGHDTQDDRATTLGRTQVAAWKAAAEKRAE